MAHTLSEHYIYPPWYENIPEDQRQGTRRVCIHCSGLCDGTTGELSDRIIVNLSDFKSSNGNAATRTTIDKIEYSTAGTAVRLEWDRASHETIALLTSDTTGVLDFSKYGGKAESSDGNNDRTGNILLTTMGFGTTNDIYDIIIHFRIKDNAPSNR